MNFTPCTINKVPVDSCTPRTTARGIRRPITEMMPVVPIIKRVITMVERQASFHNIQFVKDLTDGLPPVNVDPGQIQQVLTNLLVNAVQSMPQGGVVTVTVSQRNVSALTSSAVPV